MQQQTEYPRFSIVTSHGEGDTNYTLAVTYDDQGTWEHLTSLDAREWDHDQAALRGDKQRS